MEIITKSPEETFNLGRKIGASLEEPTVFALSGDLGSGKTTFVQGLAAGLRIKGKIVSPTFILMREYKGEKLNLYHLDLYRLEGNVDGEVENLGLKEIIGGKNVVVIEWAEKLKDVAILGRSIKRINFLNVDENERKVIIS